MGLEIVEDNWKADLDERGRALFDTMVEAEQTWTGAFDGATIYQESGDTFAQVRSVFPRPRRFIVAAPPGTPIPDADRLLQTRADFLDWLRGVDPRLGGQTTSVPVVITPDGPVSVTETGEDHITGPASIGATWSIADAWRAGVLTIEEAIDYFATRLARLEAHIETATRARQYERVREAEARIPTAREHLTAIRALPRRAGLVARLRTGRGWSFRARWPRDVSTRATPYHVPHVAIVPATDGFTLTAAKPRQSRGHAWGEPVAEIGRLVIYQAA